MLDKSRSKEKGGEPEMFLEVAGILAFGGQTCACVWGKLQEASAVLQLQRCSKRRHQETERLTSPQCSSCDGCIHIGCILNVVHRLGN